MSCNSLLATGAGILVLGIGLPGIILTLTLAELNIFTLSGDLSEDKLILIYPEGDTLSLIISLGPFTHNFRDKV